MISIDLEAGIVVEKTPEGERKHAIASPEAFALISKAWLRCGWDAKHVYSFTWMGRPIIQLPEDMLRTQEVLYHVKPDVLIETGVAHGGSLIFYAGLFKAMGKGRVIGIDIEIRPHNRKAIESHELSGMISLIEGDSAAPYTVSRVKELIRPGETVFVMLDSRHTKDHVLRELEAYAPMVSPGSWIVAADGIMGQVVGAPRTEPDWGSNNPAVAAAEFAAKHPEFVLETPAFRFNEGLVDAPITYWPDGWLRRQK